MTAPVTGASRVRELLARFANLRVLQLSHLAGSAEAFVSLSPDYFLSRFGRWYLERVFWRAFLDAPGCFGFVWMEGEQVVGFAAGTTQRDRFVADVVRRAPLAFATQCALAAIKRPAFVRDALGLVTRLREERARGGPRAELMSLGVLTRKLQPASTANGGAISPALILIAAAAARMAEKGSDEFRLYTGATNRLACAFYRRLGFREAYRFRMFREEKVCFIGHVSAPGLHV